MEHLSEIVKSPEPSPEIIRSVLSIIGKGFTTFGRRWLTSIFNQNKDFFSDVCEIIDMPDCFNVTISIIKILVDRSIKMEGSDKSLIEILFESEIIDKVYTIWAKSPIDLEILNMYTTIIQKHPEIKPYFIEKNALDYLLQYLQEYNSSEENNEDRAQVVINIIDFFSEYFNNNKDCPLIDHARFIKEIVMIYVSACAPYQEDQQKEDYIIVSIWKSCISAFNNFASNEPKKARLLINFKLPQQLFIDLNSNSLFRTVWSEALQLILKFFRSKDDDLDKLAEINIDLSVFKKILNENASIHVVNSSLIFSALIDVSPSKYATLIASSEIIDIIFEKAMYLSFKDFINVIILYCRIFFNVSESVIASKLLNEKIIERIVDTSEVEIDDDIIEDLKKIFISIYEKSDNNPEIQNIIDPVFEENGILSGMQKPLMI